MRELSVMTRIEALNGISEADSERLIDQLLHIKANMLDLDLAENEAVDVERTAGDANGN